MNANRQRIISREAELVTFVAILNQYEDWLWRVAIRNIRAGNLTPNERHRRQILTNAAIQELTRALTNQKMRVQRAYGFRENRNENARQLINRAQREKRAMITGGMSLKRKGLSRNLVEKILRTTMR